MLRECTLVMAPFLPRFLLQSHNPAEALSWGGLSKGKSNRLSYRELHILHFPRPGGIVPSPTRIAPNDPLRTSYDTVHQNERRTMKSSLTGGALKRRNSPQETATPLPESCSFAGHQSRFGTADRTSSDRVITERSRALNGKPGNEVEAMGGDAGREDHTGLGTSALL